MKVNSSATPQVLPSIPAELKNIFASPVTIGALCAMLLNFILPLNPEEKEVEDDDLVQQSLMPAESMS